MAKYYEIRYKAFQNDIEERFGNRLFNEQEANEKVHTLKSMCPEWIVNKVYVADGDDE